MMIESDIQQINQKTSTNKYDDQKLIFIEYIEKKVGTIVNKS